VGENASRRRTELGNHVIRDRLWESKKLARCSRDAALAYPWIFLVADDHGRFEYDPRRIWSKVFGKRNDVSLRQVSAWLDEYWKLGLLVRYHMDGDLAYWTGFQGRPPSQRRESDYPDPQGLTELAPSPSLGAPYPRAEQSRAELDQGGDRVPAHPRRVASRSSGAQRPDLDAPENRAPIDAYNAVFGTKIGYTPGNLRAAARALEAGYSLEHIRGVFQAVRERKTPTAVWCAENNREFEYLIRPPYKHIRTHELIQGPLDKIPNEQATGRRAG
jgi:hypothetical protein